ncbi:MAG: Hpt domain-containing protein [Rubrivivax sp.]|jgi:HPt (histidine-containing phosphotransfer) domain-containing protein|nr:Hpt domain-containing protein [Rubrivivax sp.]
MNQPSARSAAPASLDAAALERLRLLDPDGRNRVLGRVFGAFEASLVRTLEQLATQADALDAAALGGIAHALKSSSASVGALQLSAACAEVERHARGGAGKARPEDLARLLAEGEAALAAVRSLPRN